MDIKKFIEDLGERRNDFLINCRECQSATELLAMAEEENIALDEAGAAELFYSVNGKAVALSDEELENVAGGDVSYTYAPGVDFQCYILTDKAEFMHHVEAKHRREPNTCPHWKPYADGDNLHRCTCCRYFVLLY